MKASSSNRGFASMDEDRRREISSKGGKARHSNRPQSASSKNSSISSSTGSSRQNEDIIHENS